MPEDIVGPWAVTCFYTHEPPRTWVHGYYHFPLNGRHPIESLPAFALADWLDENRDDPAVMDEEYRETAGACAAYLRTVTDDASPHYRPPTATA